jgi:hypothetical protein
MEGSHRPVRTKVAAYIKGRDSHSTTWFDENVTKKQIEQAGILVMV